MDADTFQMQALRTESKREVLYVSGYDAENTRANRLLHAALGLVTEAAEFADPLKKLIFYGKSVDEVNLKEELGDILWYVAIACDALDTTILAEMDRVINKLQTRYPEKYTDQAANNRDLDAERKVLEDEA